MAPSQLDRKRRFRMALAADNKTADRWAAENDVQSSHLSSMLAGTKDNPRIASLVDDYVDATFKTYKIKAA